MKYTPYPKRDPVKNYFPLPNEIFQLRLCPIELAIYAYLSCLENRKTYQCWPSYNTIADALSVSRNTVRKYVASLEEKLLITTEHTMIRGRDGKARNGNLRYTIRPVQEALNRFHERQMEDAELALTQAKAAEKAVKRATAERC